MSGELTTAQQAAQVKQKEITKYKIIRQGKTFVIPESLSTDEAIKALQAEKVYEEQTVNFSVTFPGYSVIDAAYCFYMAMLEIFGIVHQKAIQTFFGERLPEMMQVQKPNGEIIEIPWGRISVPYFEGGYVEFGISGQEVGELKVSCYLKRKKGDEIKEVINLAKENLKTSSLYRRQAIEVRFLSSDNKPLPFPEIKFMPIGDIEREDLIFSKDTEIQIETNLFTPIYHGDVVSSLGVPQKWTCLLEGPYGTGKTLAARYTAKLGTQKGYTFIYVRNPHELSQGYQLAKIYAPSILFIEDIDQILSGERNDFQNKVANILDGVDNKHLNIKAVFTTNHVEKINRVFLRPGRFDQIISVENPDAYAVEKLIRFYAKHTLDPQADLSRIGELLAGQSPATIRACVEKAKLYQVSLSDGDINSVITSDALEGAAKQMKRQMELLEEKQGSVPPFSQMKDYHLSRAEEYEKLEHATNGQGGKL